MNTEIKQKAAKLYRENAAVLTAVFFVCNLLMILKLSFIPMEIDAVLPLKLLYIVAERMLTTFLMLLSSFGVTKCLLTTAQTGRTRLSDLFFAFSSKKIFKNAALLLLILYLPLALIEKLLTANGGVYALVSLALTIASGIYLFLTVFCFVRTPYAKTLDVIKISVVKMRGWVGRLISLMLSYVWWFLLLAFVGALCSLGVMLFLQNFSNPPDVNFIVIAMYLLGVFFMPYLELPLAIFAKRILEGSEKTVEQVALTE